MKIYPFAVLIDGRVIEIDKFGKDCFNENCTSILVFCADKKSAEDISAQLKK